MTFRDSLYFSYADVYSTDMGIINVSLNSGMQEEPFVSSRSIKEVKIKGNSRPYYQGIEYEPLQFDVSFAFENSWDADKLSEVKRWLTEQTYYQPMYFSNNVDRIYYVLAIDDPRLVHNMLSQGYVNLTFRAKDRFVYSPVYTSELYDLSANPVDGTIIQFNNLGDVNCQPELSLLKTVENGDIVINNLSDGNKEFKFVAIVNGEELYIDNENEHIETNLLNTYRYDNFFGKYLSLPRGVNNLKVTGKCKLQFRYQFKMI